MGKMLDCKTENLPIKYVGISCKSTKACDPIIEIIQKRLALWKSKVLSSSRRAQLFR